MSVSQLGESIVNNALKSAGLNAKITGKMTQSRTSIFANLGNGNQDPASGDKKEGNALIPEDVKEIIINKISRQTTIALKSLLLDDGFKANEGNESPENNLEENNEENEIERSMIGKEEESIKKNSDLEMGNVIKETNSVSEISEDDESQENSIISSKQVLEIQKERNKKIDLNILKSKRRTITMRLALLAPSKFTKNRLK